LWSSCKRQWRCDSGVTMSYSAAQLLVLSGISQNRGLAISADLLTNINAIQSTSTVCGQLRAVAVHPRVSPGMITTLRTQIPGLSLTAPISADLLPSVTLDVTGSVIKRANVFFSRGVLGFLGLFNIAVNSCQTSRDVLGSLYTFQKQGFKSISPSTNSHTDLITGGITSRFGPLAVGADDYIKASTLYTGGPAITRSPKDIQASIAAVADAITAMGSLYSFRDLQNFGTPAGLISSLNQQGLLTNSVIQLLRNQGVNLNSLTTANNNILIGILKTIQGSDLQKIITATNLTVPISQNITDASQLLQASSIMNSNAVSAIPGGSLVGLAQQLIGLNLIFNSTKELSAAFKNITIPDIPALTDLTQPIPDADIAIIEAAVPVGSGQFGSALIQELIGTPGGFVHTDAAKQIAFTVNSIAAQTKVQAVSDTAVALLAVYNAGTDATSAEANLTSAIATLVADTVYTFGLATLTTQISNMLSQLQLEITNCVRAGLDIYASTPGVTNSVLGSSVIPGLSPDPNQIGINSYLSSLVTDDIYGQSFYSILVQGLNAHALKSVSTNSIGVPDVTEVSRKLGASSGAGLTAAQRDNVIDYARNHNLDLANALENAALFGYNNDFYVSRGYAPA